MMKGTISDQEKLGQDCPKEGGKKTKVGTHKKEAPQGGNRSG